MGLKEKLERIDFEIENGLKFKAADRLRNLIQENPNETLLWNKIAKLYYNSGFLDAAGKYWILTEPTNERIRKCVDLYEKSVNYSGYQILREITFRGEKAKLSKFAQKKLAELESDSKEKMNYIPIYKPKINKPKNQKHKPKTNFKDKIITFIVFGILISIGILILIGTITVYNWVF